MAVSGGGSSAEELEAEYAGAGGKVLDARGGAGGAEDEEEVVRRGVPSISLMMYDGGGGCGVGGG